MTEQTQDKWLKLAERIDAFRVFPRIFVMGYGYMAMDIWFWVKTVPTLTATQSAFTTSIVGLCIPLLGWYFSTGRKWS